MCHSESLRGLCDDFCTNYRLCLRQKSQKKRQESDSDESSNSSDDDVPTYKSRNSIYRQVSDDTSSSSEVGDDESSDGEREFTSTKVTAVDIKKANYWVDEKW